MSTQETTKTITRREIWQRIAVAVDAGLPEPLQIRLYDSRHESWQGSGPLARVYVDNQDAAAAWASVVGAKERNDTLLPDGATSVNYDKLGRASEDGWSWTIHTEVPAPAPVLVAAAVLTPDSAVLPAEPVTMVWSCPVEGCGYHIAGGPKEPDGEPTTDELVAEHLAEHEAEAIASALTDGASSRADEAAVNLWLHLGPLVYARPDVVATYHELHGDSGERALFPDWRALLQRPLSDGEYQIVFLSAALAGEPVGIADWSGALLDEDLRIVLVDAVAHAVGVTR